MTKPKLEVVHETVFDCSFLDGGVETQLVELPEQRMIAYQGMTPRGPFDRELDFVNRVPESERHALYAYLNNRDVQQQPSPSAQRVIIDVYDDLLTAGLGAATPNAQETWLKSNLPSLYKELQATVFRMREKLPDSNSNAPHKERWWLFGSVREGLRAAWHGLDRIIVIGTVGKVFKPTEVLTLDPRLNIRVSPTHAFFVIPSESRAVASVLSSILFETLVRRSCSSLQTTLRFTPSEVFPYFPFPWKGQPTDNKYVAPVLNPPTDVEQRLAPIANALLKLREEIMAQPTAAFRGPTALYNAFDNPDDKRPAIQALREAHLALEAAVLAEYGWSDLAGPDRWKFDRPWIDGTWRFVPNAETRREYLRRLERLNHEQGRPRR